MANGSFPLRRVVKVGYSETFQNFGKILKLAWVPAVVAIAAGFLVDLVSFFWHLAGRPGTHPLFGPWAQPILLTRMIVVECSLAIFALAIFRYRLLGWSKATDHVSLAIGKHECAFFGAALLAVGIHVLSWRFAPGAIVSSMASVHLFSAGVALVIMIVLARLCFPLAAMVTNQKETDDRRVTVRGWLRLVAVLVLTKGAVSVFNSVDDILYEFGIEDASYSLFFSWARDYMPMPTAVLLHATMLNALLLAIPFLGSAIAATAVSEAYKLRSSGP